MLRAALAAGLVAVLGGSASPRACRRRRLPRLPASNPWNRRVDALPVAQDSATLVALDRPRPHVHADFGSGLWDGGPIGIPVTVVSAKAAEGARRASTTPTRATAARTRSRRTRRSRAAHATATATCSSSTATAAASTSSFDAHRSGGGWTRRLGRDLDLRSNALRPAGWTSADAAGLPILPGLARYDEVAAGAIDHALRFTAAAHAHARSSVPARHYASELTDPTLPPMGLRVRLKASFDTRGFPRQARVVLEALKRYGMILADNGSPWYISGAPDPRWDNDDLHTLGRVDGSDFEVVDTSSLRP